MSAISKLQDFERKLRNATDSGALRRWWAIFNASADDIATQFQKNGLPQVGAERLTLIAYSTIRSHLGGYLKALAGDKPCDPLPINPSMQAIAQRAGDTII